MSLEEVRNYLNTIRRDFSSKPLDEHSVKDNPLEQYGLWFEDAIGCQVPDPYAACLSTVDKQGTPSSRMIYIRDITEDGFVFYTNYKSKKADNLSVNVNAALNVYWVELERQIRIQGKIQKVDSKTSDTYFNNRPRESQLGAWASEQSKTLSTRQDLMDNFNHFEKKFKGKEVPRPPHWGGYQLLVEKIEFWQGRPNRLHDRILYVKEADQWRRSRLSP